MKNKTFTHKFIELPKIEEEMIDGKRFYKTPQNNLYPSVTTVLSSMSKEGIEEWKNRVGEEEAARVLKKANERGTLIHHMAEQYLLNCAITPNMTFLQLKPYLDRIDNVYGLEVPLYSDYLQIAGRTDCIADYEGKPSIIDFKTSRRIKEKDNILSYFLQASCYSYMFEERTGIRIPQIAILIVDDYGGTIPHIEKRSNYKEQLLHVITNFRQSVKNSWFSGI